MAGEPPNDMAWWSALEDYPEHVRAIGMISIENANLDYELPDLFSRIIFENAFKAVLARRRTTKIANQQRQSLKKPFASPLAHAQLLGSGQTRDVLRFPTKQAQAPVPLANLQNLVRDFRLLICDAARLGRLVP